VAGESKPANEKWELARPEDRARWWIRDQLYTIVPRTPLSDSVFTPQWDEAVICIGDVLKFPDSRGFNARTVNGYTYLSPMKITDPAVINERLGQFLANVQQLSSTLDHDLVRYHEEQERELVYWRDVDLLTPNLMTLLEHWRRALQTMDRFWKLHFLIVFPRHVVAMMLEHAAHDLAGLTGSREIAKLTQSHGMTRQLELDMGLWKLAARAIDLGLKEMFLETLENSLKSKLEADENGRIWLGQLAPFLERFGARTVIPDELSDQTWQENPTPVLGTVRAYIAQGGKYDFDRVLKEMTVEREQLVKETLGKIGDPAEREKFRSTLTSARKFQQAMEDDNYYFLWSHALVRKVALGIGARLHSAGVLDSADDVVFLYRDQMERAVVDLASGVYNLSPYTAIAREQKVRWERWCQLQPPPYIGDLPDEIEDVMVNHFWGIRGRRHLEETQAKISGLGASAGVVEGIARHVCGPQDFGKIQPGEIMICGSTNPAWSPVFSKIAAVITDQGGTLSHTAIVAREYGLPAVLGTINGTKRIPNGARIRVDGAAGTVEVL
jgi:phosphohistidine swiveling domain-containing protein